MKRIQTFPLRLSLRWKAILGIALIEAVLLSILIYSSMHFMEGASEKQLQDYVRLTRGNLVSMTQDAVLAMDLARLTAFAEEAQKTPGIRYVRILDASGVILAQNGRDMLRPPRPPDTHLSAVDDGMFDLVGNIEIDGTLFGRVEAGIDVTYLQDLVSRARVSSWGVAGLEMGLVALFSFILGTYLTRQLKRLEDAAQRISAGELGYQVPEVGGGVAQDELAGAIRVFNTMSKQLKENEVLAQNYASEMMQLIHRFDTVLDLSPDSYLHFDQAHRVTNANSAFERITGQPLGDMLGQSLEQVIAQLQRQSDPTRVFPLTSGYFEQAWDDLQTPLPVATVYLQQPQARVLDCEYRTNPSDGSSVLYLRDVTRLTELDRMKSQFLATAAHELRTPMASIVGFSELLLNHQFDAAMVRDSLETIHRQGVNLTEMLNELLDLARIEARTANLFNFSVLPVMPIVRESVNNVSIGHTRHTVRLEMHDNLPSVRADAEQLSRAIRNLLSNAFKYSPEGGEVTVQVRQEPGAEGEPWVCISVTDQGIGMTPEQVARVFERFYRADMSGHIPGTGLGMSITKEIVDMHGGRIEIVSTPGQGTTVTLRLLAVTDVSESLAS